MQRGASGRRGQEVGVQVRVRGERDRQPVPPCVPPRRSRGASTASACPSLDPPRRPNYRVPRPRWTRSVFWPQLTPLGVGGRGLLAGRRGKLAEPEPTRIDTDANRRLGQGPRLTHFAPVPGSAYAPPAAAA